MSLGSLGVAGTAGGFIANGAAIATRHGSMIGDGVTDNLARWNTLISNYDYVVIDSGDFLFSGPMVVPSDKTVVGLGNGVNGSLIRGTSGQAAALQVGDGSSTTKNWQVGGFLVVGAANKGVFINSAYRGHLFDIDVYGTFTDGIAFHRCFGSLIDNVSTSGSTISNACFAFGEAFNANVCNQLYTSNLNSAYNFLFDRAYNSGTEVSIGNTYNGLVAQGGDVGIYLLDHTEATFNSIYTENTITPFVFGNAGSSRGPIAITINAPVISAGSVGATNYAARLMAIDASYCDNITINDPRFGGCFNCGNGANVSFSGGGGSGASAVAIIHPDGQINHIVVLQPGSGYTGAPTVSISGGTGSGATATASLSGDGVDSVTVTDGGSGFTAVGCPVALRYNDITRFTINNPYINDGKSSKWSSLWPYIVKDSGASNGSQLEINGLISGRYGSSGPTKLFKALGYGPFFLECYDASGNINQWTFAATQMTT